MPPLEGMVLACMSPPMLKVTEPEVRWFVCVS